jgi:hypothetical protein
MKNSEKAFKNNIGPSVFLPWNNRYFLSIIGLLQKIVQITHHLLEGIGHEIQRSVCEDHGIFRVHAKVIFRHGGVGEPVAARREGSGLSPGGWPLDSSHCGLCS